MSDEATAIPRVRRRTLIILVPLGVLAGFAAGVAWQAAINRPGPFEYEPFLTHSKVTAVEGDQICVANKDGGEWSEEFCMSKPIPWENGDWLDRLTVGECFERVSVHPGVRVGEIEPCE